LATPLYGLVELWTRSSILLQQLLLIRRSLSTHNLASQRHCIDALALASHHARVLIKTGMALLHRRVAPSESVEIDMVGEIDNGK
jgi:hypothetical protein